MPPGKSVRAQVISSASRLCRGSVLPAYPVWTVRFAENAAL